MKLFLTSTGLENMNVSRYFETSFLPKEPKDLSFLVISIQDSEQDAFYLDKTLTEIKNTGAINIDVFKLGNEKFTTDKEYDVVFVCGGNTFDYLDRVRKTGLDKFIVDFSKKENSVYVGVSAGSILAGPDIAIAGDEDSNDIGLTDLRGLCLTDFIVYPHYRKELKTQLDEFKKRNGYPIIELEDNQAVILNYSNIGNLKGVLSMSYINKDL
ncbi:MAG TPA: Type 1 glutamine amidotransferase-like domain-containing protein [Candidatus Paceibacterota bacterium]|nr:MAG: putative peptidase [Parcubacteria group bacterium ADurb.Bin115]HQM18896.1 Type 1 glutamine amidotransferase-like domain-containing protein [Candidatus Paceibacterota bacterium]